MAKYSFIYILVFLSIKSSACTESSEIPSGCVYYYKNISIAPQWEIPENDHYIEEQRVLKDFCGFTKTFVLVGSYVKPQACQSLTICNVTSCLQLQISGSRHFYITSPYCKDVWEQSDFKPTTTSFQTITAIRAMDLLSRAKSVQKYYYKDSGSVIADKQQENDGCRLKANSHLLLDGIGMLPTECTDLRFCSDEKCIQAPLLSLKDAILFSRSRESVHGNMVLPSPCSLSTKHQLDATALSDDFSDHASTKTRHTLMFNLPGYYYCGYDHRSGIKPEPVDTLDTICKQREEDILAGISHGEADSRLLDAIWQIHHPLLPLFVAAIESKLYFEETIQVNYTSSIYYVQDPKDNLKLRIRKSSITEAIENQLTLDSIDDNVLSQGRMLEERWEKLLHGVWSSYCYMHTLPLPKQLSKQNAPSEGSFCPTKTPIRTYGRKTPRTTPSPASTFQTPSPPTTIQPQTTASPSPGFSGRGSFRPQTRKSSDCKIVIAEVLPLIVMENGSPKSFVEIQKLCPDSEPRTSAVSMALHHLLIIQIGEPSMVHLSYIMTHDDKLKLKWERTHNRRAKQVGYYVVGSEGVQNDRQFDSIEFAQQYNGVKGIPSDEGKTYVILLLKYPDLATAYANHITFNQLHRGNQPIVELFPTAIEDHQRFVIREYIQDLYIYGSPCQLRICGDFSGYLHQSVVLDPKDMHVPIPIPLNLQVESLWSDKSSSRCSTSILPRRPDYFQERPPTPGRMNDCVKMYSFEGSRLQSTAQKLVVNVNNFFTNYEQNRVLISGSALDMTALVTHLFPGTVRKVMISEHEGKPLTTPGKTRRSQPKQRCHVDDFHVSKIHQIIQGFYKDNLPPFAADIYDKFIEFVRHSEQLERDAGRNDFVPFQCTQRHFRKILRRLGFTYGKIHLRDAVLMRPDIVSWRGKYLSAMRANRRAEEPMSVVWIDETWIDPFARTGKAWVMKKTSSYRERRLYSYNRHKVGRGGRLIVLNAGGEDGFVPGALSIYAVSKKKDTTNDYHDNVNAETFMSWFEDLLDALDATNKKYIIVMDNAPYHGKSDVPKSTATKQEMYDWLVDNLPLDERPALLPIEYYRKPELWQIVKEKKGNTDFFIIDQMARARGHKVVRLPPYNCDLNPIEMVWGYTKGKVRELNTEQTIKSVRDLATEIMTNFPSHLWGKYVAEVRRLEEEYWTADGFFEEAYDTSYRLVINVNDEDDSDDDDELANDSNFIPIDPNVVTSTVHQDINEDIDEDDEEGDEIE